MTDKRDRARKESADKMLVIDIEALESSIVELGAEVGIPTFSPNYTLLLLLFHPQR